MARILVGRTLNGEAIFRLLGESTVRSILISDISRSVGGSKKSEGKIIRPMSNGTSAFPLLRIPFGFRA